MTALRSRMIDQMKLRDFRPKTHQAYLGAVSGLAKYYQTPPDQLTSSQIQSYLVHRIDQGLSWSTINVAICALRFFYEKTLGWDPVKLPIPPRKRVTHLPEILSGDEVERIFGVTKNVTHRALLMTTYAAGLRVSEVVALRVTDIESGRMLIRVEQGKGKKDRYTLLSERLLTELRSYWRRFRPQPWLFPGKIPGKHLSASAAQRAYEKARGRAGIAKGSGIQTLRHCFATHLLEAGVEVVVIQKLLGHAGAGQGEVAPCPGGGASARALLPRRLHVAPRGQSPHARESSAAGGPSLPRGLRDASHLWAKRAWGNDRVSCDPPHVGESSFATTSTSTA